MENTFAHFGCWNYDFCPGNNFETVLNSIETDGIENLYVAGDNYYDTDDKDDTNEKVKDFKSLGTDGSESRKKLLSGFNCLKNSSIKNIHICMGNRDVNVHDKQCNVMKIINEEKLTSRLNIHLFNFIEKNDYNILIIDTSIYETKKNAQCYNEFDKKENVFNFDDISLDDNTSSFQYEQEQFIREKLQNCDEEKNLIVIGHHPLIGVHSKIDKKKQKEVINKALLKRIFENIIIPNYKGEIIYLCADIHLYQKSTIDFKDRKKITQYIAGTGGTRLDQYIENINDKDPIKNINKDLKDDNIIYEMIDNINNNHGYLKCNITKDNIEIVFQSVNKDNKGRGGKSKKRKSKKRKTKKRRTKKKNKCKSRQKK